MFEALIMQHILPGVFIVDLLRRVNEQAEEEEEKDEEAEGVRE